MSYTMVTKTFTSTTPKTLAPEIAAWLEEQIPEVTLMYTKTSESYYNHSYVAFDGMSYGFCISSYYDDRSIIYLAPAHSVSDSSGAKNTSVMAGDTSGITTNGVTSYSHTIAVVKTGSGYIICSYGASLYIGYITSALIGKRFISIVMSDLSGLKCYRLDWGSAHYTTGISYGLSHSEDASTYNNAVCAAMVSEKDAMPSGSAILSPFYVLHESLWVEPVVIPDVYYMQASSYPELFTPTQIGDKEAVLVGHNIAVV